MGLLVSGAVALPLERTVTAQTVFPSRMALSALPKPFTVPFGVPQVARPVRTTATTDFYRMVSQPFIADVLPGFKTEIWGYHAQFPGPTIKVPRGRQTVVRHINGLPKTHPVLKYTPWTSVHLHGSPSLPPYDGYASDISNPGWYKDYIYPNTPTPRTLWYHDHGVHHTAENVSMGLEAQYHLLGGLERSLPIPHGAYDIPLIVCDAMFNSDGSLLFNLSDESGMYGDVILVNGRPWPVMKVQRRKYRFRLLNGSVSRSYNWSLDSGDPFIMIGTDGGLMPHPQRVLSFRQGMAERYEFVIDFAKYPAGRRVILRNSSPKNNITFDNTNKVMAFDVVSTDFDPRDNSVPDTLDPNNPTMLLKEADAVLTRQQELKRTNGQWTISGHTWDEVVASNFTFSAEKPLAGTTEIWEVANPHGGWFHPVHIHLIDFQVLSRNGRPPFAYERGAKDVVYVGENETVRLLIHFGANEAGKYMTHCHNLVHEDHDMMTQFEVINPNVHALGPLSRLAQPLPESSPV
jgi:FtsP/CotA-like multicopper oxidase with cupredoxin domain